MESRKRPRRGTSASRVVTPELDTGSAELAYIAMLIDNGGQITLGALHPIACAAIANDDHGSLAMLKRRSGESIPQLLRRLNDSIALAIEADEMIDEINVRTPKRRR